MRRRARRWRRGKPAPRWPCSRAAPEEERGGNSTYTAGAVRVVFHGVDDLAQLYDLTETRSATSISAATRPTSSSTTWAGVTNYRCDPELTDILIGRSFETLKWMRGKGVRFQPSYGRQAFKVNGKYKFWEAWRSRPGAAGRAWSISSTRRRSRPASPSITRRRRCR